MTGRIYHLEFLTKRGCELGVLAEMARHDSARVVNTANDATCEGERVRFATLQATPHKGQPLGSEPTMQRWASFAVGARIVHRFWFSDQHERSVSLLAVDGTEALTRARSLGHNPRAMQQEVMLRDGTLSCKPVDMRKAAPRLTTGEEIRLARHGEEWEATVDVANRTGVQIDLHHLGASAEEAVASLERFVEGWRKRS